MHPATKQRLLDTFSIPKDVKILYGTSELTEYMQGVAHRNSRYAATFAHVLMWPNFVNHPYHGVDTAKYYRQAELELEQERGR